MLCIELLGGECGSRHKEREKRNKCLAFHFDNASRVAGLGNGDGVSLVPRVGEI